MQPNEGNMQSYQVRKPERIGLTGWTECQVSTNLFRHPESLLPLSWVSSSQNLGLANLVTTVGGQRSVRRREREYLNLDKGISQRRQKERWELCKLAAHSSVYVEGRPGWFNGSLDAVSAIGGRPVSGNLPDDHDEIYIDLGSYFCFCKTGQWEVRHWDQSRVMGGVCLDRPTWRL